MKNTQKGYFRVSSEELGKPRTFLYISITKKIKHSPIASKEEGGFCILPAHLPGQEAQGRGAPGSSNGPSTSPTPSVTNMSAAWASVYLVPGSFSARDGNPFSWASFSLQHAFQARATPV